MTKNIENDYSGAWRRYAYVSIKFGISVFISPLNTCFQAC